MKFSTPFVVWCAGLCAAAATAQTLPSAVHQAPRPLIAQRIDDSQLVPLRNNVHPLARPQNDRGSVADSLVLSHLRILLQRAPEGERAVREWLSQVHDPASPSYHRWLTPEETGLWFGAAQQDIEAISGWLDLHGLEIDRVDPDRMTIEFHGTAAHVGAAFHTGIHRYFANGAEHWANASDPRIPAGMAAAVAGVAGLSSFGAHPAYHDSARIRRNPESGRPGRFQSLWSNSSREGRWR